MNLSFNSMASFRYGPGPVGPESSPSPGDGPCSAPACRQTGGGRLRRIPGAAPSRRGREVRVRPVAERPRVWSPLRGGTPNTDVTPAGESTRRASRRVRDHSPAAWHPLLRRDPRRRRLKPLAPGCGDTGEGPSRGSPSVDRGNDLAGRAGHGSAVGDRSDGHPTIIASIPRPAAGPSRTGDGPRRRSG